MSREMSIPAIRREIRVAATADRTFTLFTERIGDWWPLGDHAVFGDGTVAFEGKDIVERSGERATVWAEVTEWDPPRVLRLNWHPGGPVERATDLMVSFLPEGEQTLVVLEHTGWERLSDPAAAAREYGEGWLHVLDRFAALVDTAESAWEEKEPGDRWYALLHRPGPALGDQESIFAHEAFGEHVAFLNRLADRGLLVAAGPLPDESGAGMTIVRVRPEHGDVDVTALATVDDQCVAGGYLQVDRPAVAGDVHRGVIRCRSPGRRRPDVERRRPGPRADLRRDADGDRRRPGRRGSPRRSRRSARRPDLRPDRGPWRRRRPHVVPEVGWRLPWRIDLPPRVDAVVEHARRRRPPPSRRSPRPCRGR